MPQGGRDSSFERLFFLNETFTLNLVEYHMCRVRVIFVLVMFEVPLG